jgi:hypothetical protein
MNDRLRLERRNGRLYFIDRQAGYCREPTKWERAALGKEIAEQAELEAITDGQIPVVNVG